MVDYYNILGVRYGCSRQEIKKGFRRQAKLVHPDIQRNSETAEDRMRLLLKAYEVLGNPDSRQEYDAVYPFRKEGGEFDYRMFLMSRKDDPESQARLIFFDLLHGNEDEAVDLYEFLRKSSLFHLEKHLDQEEFMDCAFILAEELEKREQYINAYGLLKKIVLFENERPYFRHFFEEVVTRLRVLVCMKMPGRIAPDLLLVFLKELMLLNLSKRDTARFARKIAEVHLRQVRYG